MSRFIPSLSALTAFEAAASHLSFTHAADQLGITQSGVSRQVKTLEDLLGTRLFERNGPRLVLTEAGQGYFADIAPLLDGLESASIDVVRGKKTEAALAIGALPSVASRWLAPRLEAFSAQRPDAFYEVVPVSDVPDFATSPLDLAILRGGPDWKNARSQLLAYEHIAVVASPKLIAAGNRLDVSEFAAYPQLQNSARPDSWMTWLKAMGHQHRGRLQGPRFGFTSMLINAALGGLGLAVVPVFMVEAELASGALHLPFGAPVASGEAYYVVYPDRKAHRGEILEFRDWLLRETRILRQVGPGPSAG